MKLQHNIEYVLRVLKKAVQHQCSVYISEKKGINVSVFADIIRSIGSEGLIWLHGKETEILKGPHGVKDEFLSDRLKNIRLMMMGQFSGEGGKTSIQGSDEGIDSIIIEEVAGDEANRCLSSVVPLLRIGGVVLILAPNCPGAVCGSLTEALFKDPMFIEVGGTEKIKAFRKISGPPEMILCTGLQSGGTTLVSWCFLQRRDMEGILDMWSEGILQMPYMTAPLGWCKMVTANFRWEEVASFYRDMGWRVKPLLVVRDVRSAYASLRKKPYGLNGVTAEDPPLRMRFRRFRRDYEEFKANQWPILQFESFLEDPENELQTCCEKMAIPYLDDMIRWPKRADEINEVDVDGVGKANETFRLSLSGRGCFESVIKNKRQVMTHGIPKLDLKWLEEEFYDYNCENEYSLHVDADCPASTPDRPSYYVTKKKQLERILESKFWKLTGPVRTGIEFFINHFKK